VRLSGEGDLLAPLRALGGHRAGGGGVSPVIEWDDESLIVAFRDADGLHTMGFSAFENYLMRRHFLGQDLPPGCTVRENPDGSLTIDYPGCEPT
jgi:hypothetical protein